jgi:hypothetical protein
VAKCACVAGPSLAPEEVRPVLQRVGGAVLWPTELAFRGKANEATEDPFLWFRENVLRFRYNHCTSGWAAPTIP